MVNAATRREGTPAGRYRFERRCVAGARNGSGIRVFQLLAIETMHLTPAVTAAQTLTKPDVPTPQKS